MFRDIECISGFFDAIVNGITFLFEILVVYCRKACRKYRIQNTEIRTAEKQLLLSINLTFLWPCCACLLVAEFL